MTSPNLMVILAHPDDETFPMGGTLAKAAFDQYQQELGRPLRLYYIAPLEATQQGCGIPPPVEAVGGPVAFIDVGEFLVQKVRAAQQHQSQNPPFTGDPETEAQNMVCHELFRLARPRLAANGHGPETDLFAGLNGVNSQKLFRSIT